MRSWMFLAVLLLSGASAIAQSATPEPPTLGTSPDLGPSGGQARFEPGLGSSLGSNNYNTTVSIVNSTSARLALSDAGFTEIISLKPGLDGWVAEAIRDGKAHTVTVDEEDGTVEVVR